MNTITLGGGGLVERGRSGGSKSVGEGGQEMQEMQGEQRPRSPTSMITRRQLFSQKPAVRDNLTQVD